VKPLVWIRRLARDTRGNVLLIGAAALPLMIGAAGVGVDSITLVVAKRQLQRSADSGALAGAYALVQSKSVSASAIHDLGLNNDVVLKTRTIENAPTAGAYKGRPSAVRVVLTAQRSTPFMSFFDRGDAILTAEATAAVVYTGKFCMVALEEGTSPGVSFGGNTTVDLGCGVASNSKGTTGISAGGSSTIIASPIAAVGGVPASSSYANGTKLLPYSPKQADPFARLPTPQLPPDCTPAPLTVSPGAVVTVPTKSSGVYCFKGMDVKGTLNLPPGTYYVDGGTMSLGSQAKISGTGVTVILTSSTASADPSSVAGLSINGGAQINLSAPKTGTYGGVLFYQDPRALLGNAVKINGNSLSSFEGGFYFPKAYLTMNGTSGMRTECLQLVARRLDFSGNNRVSNDCPTDGDAKAFDATFVRLVA
jgi:Flp pilus assembly protein TadG